MAKTLFRFLSFALMLVLVSACGSDEPNGGDNPPPTPGETVQPLRGSYSVISRMETTGGIDKPAENIGSEIWYFNHNNTFTLTKNGVSYTGQYMQTAGTVDIGYEIENGPDGKETIYIDGLYETNGDLVTLIYRQQTQKTVKNEEGKPELKVITNEYSATLRKV